MWIYIVVALALIVGIIGAVYLRESPSATQKLPNVGDKLSGFTVQERGYIDTFAAETITLHHNKSGATVLFVLNDDDNRSFNITYRTYYTDESDFPHVFEHVVLSSSEKYQSKELFFDLANNTYNTFMNAQTNLTTTKYIASSKSEAQLKKIMDAYLSCMVSPSVLTNENFFKREALRYELLDQNSPITISGTVFSEDTEYVTNLSENAIDYTLDALYPNQVASNMLGKATENLKILTYDKMKHAFEEFYNFDNSLVVIYGNTDYKDLLDYLDSEYLSKAENKHTNLSSYKNEPTEPGFVNTTNFVPAYMGDKADDASRIDYAISLSSYSWKDLLKFDLLADMLNNEASPIQEKLRKANINNHFSCEVCIDAVKPYMSFSLSNTDEYLKDDFKNIVDNALEEIKNNGLDSELLNTVLKKRELQNNLAREQGDINTYIHDFIGYYWSSTGKTDYYEQLNLAQSEISADSQTAIKDMSKSLLSPHRSALVATIPKPGLAEECIAQREQYLADLKSSMSQDELQTLMQNTLDFQTWNSSASESVKLAIDTDELPDPEEAKELSIEHTDGMDFYTYPLENDKLGFFRLDFDISNVPKEDLYYLNLYTMLLGNVDTKNHDDTQTKLLVDNYLSTLNIEYTYIPLKDKTVGKPSVCFSWTGMSADYETSLDFLLELLTSTKINDRDKIITRIEKKLPYLDKSTANSIYLAFDLADSQSSKSLAFHSYMESQDYYRFVKNELEKLKLDPNYILTLEEKLSTITNLVLQKNGLRMFTAVQPKEAPHILDISKEKLGMLPSTPIQNCSYHDIFVMPPATGFIVETPDQTNILTASIDTLPQFHGKFLPYLSYINSEFITPKIRFENGAYASQGDYLPNIRSFQFYSVCDPNIEETYRIYHQIPDFLLNSNLSQDELDTCIINIYGSLTRPRGEIYEGKLAYSRKLINMDSKKIEETIQQIKEATLEDQEAAANLLEKALASSKSVTVGNEKVLMENANLFDTVLNFKK